MDEITIRGYALSDDSPHAKLNFINYCRGAHEEGAPLDAALVTRLFRLAGAPDPDWVLPDEFYILSPLMGDDLLKAAQERLVMDHCNVPEVRRAALRVIQATAGIP